MRSDKTRLALQDIRDNMPAARRFTGTLTFAAFSASDLHFYAVTRALKIISEATCRLPDGFREKHSALAWKQIMGIGNTVHHNYDDVVEQIVRDNVQDDLEPLLCVVAS
jgi:uncharacterized protein with HEPN domain